MICNYSFWQCGSEKISRESIPPFIFTRDFVAHRFVFCKHFLMPYEGSYFEQRIGS
ncbi:MAG: hypothetical protein JJT94_01580 [Bernardetiaceae bacterium]|nr:hypothetical protein [Bernardetiaceae bacterium]